MEEQNKNKKYLRVYLAFLLLAVGFVLGLITGQGGFNSGSGQVKNLDLNLTNQQSLSNSQANKNASGSVQVPDKPAYLYKDVNFSLFKEVWDLVKNNYVDRDKILDTELFYGALRGIVASLGDPHTTLYDPEETADFSKELEGNFEGIGAEINIKKDQLVIVAPLPGTPAEKAGLKAGDAILEIDGKNTASLFVDEAVKMIRGKEGTAVELLISREGWDEPKKIKIIRAKIHFDSVSWNLRDDGIFYVEINNFNDDTMKLFEKAIREILTKKPKGLILDLRNDPGGYLDQAVSVASEWVTDGPVVLEEDKDGKRTPLDTNAKARLKNFKAVVLINGGSASGSEIVAGALQDYGLATLVGEKTFGKGSVQELKPLSDGSSVKITIARWLTPKGRSIDKEGITPDLEVKLTADDFNNNKDPQLDRAVEILLGDKK